MIFPACITLLSLLSTAVTSSILPRHDGLVDANALLKTVYQFPNTTWIENIAVRSNGKILITILFTPEIWQVDPHTNAAELIYTFPSLSAVTGIAEYAPDVFGVAAGNFTLAGGQPGSYSIYSLDFNKRRHHSDSPTAKISKITSIPPAVLLNGMTAPPSAHGILLVSDSGAGLIYRVDTKTGTYSTFLDHPTLKPKPGREPVIGVNGVQVRGNYLYYTNTFLPPLLGRVLFNAKTAMVSGPVETVFETPTYPLNAGGGISDDFTLDRKGNVWLATASSSLVKLDLETKEQILIAGEPDSFELVGTTATKFARDGKTLYITTNGGISDPVNGIQGGKVVSLDTSLL